MSMKEKKSSLDKIIRNHAEEIHAKMISELESILDKFFEDNDFLQENSSWYRYTETIFEYAKRDKERVLEKIEKHELEKLFKQLDIK